MNVYWSTPNAGRRPSRALLGRTVSGFVWVVCGLAALAVYTNVMADDSELHERTRALACERSGSRDECRVVRMQGKRSVLEYRTKIETDNGLVFDVVCRRSAIVLGEHACQIR